MENLLNPDVYLKAFKLVKAYVISNSGNIQDVQDTMQEGLLAFFKHISRDTNDQQGDYEYYILKICSNLWLKELRRRRQYGCTEVGRECIDHALEGEVETISREELLYQLIERNIPKLSPRCREVFLAREKGLTYHEIAAGMGLSNYMIAKDKYFRCKKRLIALIKQDPDYINLVERA